MTAHVDAKLADGIIDGKMIANEMREKMKQEIAAKDLKPYLVTVLVGEDPASHTYVSFKEKACNSIGIKNTVYRMPVDTTEEQLWGKIDELKNHSFIKWGYMMFPTPAGTKAHGSG